MMVLLDFFKPESEKIRDANNYNKKETLKRLESIKNASRSVEISQLLNQIIKQLTGQQQTTSEKVIDIDERISKKIGSVSQSSAKQNVGGAVNDLLDILELVVERGAYCTSQSLETRAERRERERAERMANKYASETQEASQGVNRQDEIDEKQYKLDQLKDKYNKLLEIYNECPSDALDSRLSSIEIKVDEVQREINMLKSDKRTGEEDAVIEDLQKTASHINETTTVNKTKTAVHTDELMQSIADMEDRNATVNENYENVMSAIDGMSSTRTRGTVSSTAPATRSRLDTTANAAPTRTPFGKGNSSIGTSNSLFGDSGHDTTARDKQREIQREIDVIEKQIDAYNSKIQDAQDEINEIATELAPLIKQFEAASPLQRPRIDSEIMGLKRKLKAIQHNIKTYEQEKQNREIALGTKQMELGHADIAAMNEKGGRSIDVQGIKDAAMGVREDTIKANEKHSEFTDIESVANSVGVEKESFDDLGVDSFETEDIDSHKHDDLKELLGMI